MTTTSTSALEDIQAREARHVLQTYRRAPVTFVRGKGVRLYDADGREYLDLLSGIGVASLGHAHPGLARAIADQAQTLLHTSNLFFHPLQGQLAERLAKLSGLPRAFFCNSGTEAVEACLKFARRYWYTRGEPRAEIIALEESFHGRTFGALSVTSDEHYRAPFEPLLPGVRFVPVNDPAALLAAVSSNDRRDHRRADSGRRRRPAADAGVRRRDQRGVREDRRAAHRRRSAERPRAHRPAVLLRGARPEAASGVGRQGARRRRAGRRRARQRGSRGDDLVRRSRQHLRRQPARLPRGALLPGRAGRRRRCSRTSAGSAASSSSGCARSRPAHPIVKEVRGAGLIWGLELTRDAAPVVPAALARGVVVNRTAETVVRLLPPLVITAGPRLGEGARPAGRGARRRRAP